MSQSFSLPVTESPDPFAARLAADGRTLRRGSLRTLQLNLGKMCNIACHHCHVEAGPSRTEMMTWETMQRILDWLDEHREQAGIEIVDMTGGSPEMNPHFKQLVVELRKRGLHLLDRCNPTILMEPGFEDMPNFLAEHGVEIVASLPCYLEDNVDAQRGNGVFEKSIAALRKLNDVGYGQSDTGDHAIPAASTAASSGKSEIQNPKSLVLDLVYNPVGYGLPPAQAELEVAYKKHLLENYGIIFNRLWTITNMPIKRFEHALRRDGKFEQYRDKLIAAHHSDNVDAVMCRHLISVGWQGTVYDCDFNQMLQMTVSPTSFGPGDEEARVERDGRKLWQFTPTKLIGRSIRTGDHCFGCTAGAGSSCTGALR